MRSCGFDELIALKFWPLLHLQQCSHLLKSKGFFFRKIKTKKANFCAVQWGKNYLRDKNRSGYDENMDMMKRKQLTSKDGGDVKATKSDDQEQAWCKKERKLYKKS